MEDSRSFYLNPPYHSKDPAEVKALLLDWVVQGKMMKAFCKQEDMPCIKTIYNWLRDDLTFAEELREAKFIGYDVQAQTCLEIADNATPADVQVAKLRIWTRLQLLARWDSARYGDKILVGGDGGDPIRVMNDTEVMKEILGLLAVAKTRQLRDPDNRLSHDALN